MHKKVFGAQRNDLLEWLNSTWLENGPPICFIEGFPGVGKTALASELSERLLKNQSRTVCFEEIADRVEPSLVDAFIDLSANLSSNCQSPEMEAELLGEEEINLSRALEKALRQNVLIIIDDVQRLFKRDSGEPTTELSNILSTLNSRRGLHGRILLLSDRLLERGRWCSEIPIKSLNELSVQEAIELLDDRLADAQIGEAVPEDRKIDLVQALGRNPRAIETLVSTLKFESLDEVIGRHPGFWTVSDREVSRDFLLKLEKDLLDRSISRLDRESYRYLLFLSVHRKNFEQPVFQILCSGKSEAGRQLANTLVTRFLLKQVNGWYSIQPIVREIGLSHLKEHDGDFRLAHARAADYYSRPLKSRDSTGFNSRLVNSFSEARYHLYHAGKLDELRQLLIQMMDVALAEMTSTSPVPTDKELLNERIELLSILLQEDAPLGLHYYLARCLRARNNTGDLDRAIQHSKSATAGKRATADSWVLFAQLLEQKGDTPNAIEAIYNALDSVPTKDKRFALYHYGATLLKSNGRMDDAMLLLQEGILNVPVEKNLTPLYIKLSEYYIEQDRSELVIALLLEGIKRIPAKCDLISLYRILTNTLIDEEKLDEASSILERALADNIFNDDDIHILQSQLELVNDRARLITVLPLAQEIQNDNMDLSEVTADIEYKSHVKIGAKIRVLVLAMEWASNKGGLSTFNRQLCKSLAALGHEVVCVVPEINGDDFESAKASNVSLIAATSTIDEASSSSLLRKLPLDYFVPDLVIGHGRITGPAAKAQVEDWFPSAKRIHFVHMAPGEIEWYKGKDDAAQEAEKREQIELELCRNCDLVSAVGPRLYLEFGNLISALTSRPPLFQFNPGFQAGGIAEPPPGFLCLVLGRAEDKELKGLDIAASAMARLLESGSEFSSTPELIIRGAPAGTGSSLRDTLRKEVYPSDLSIRVKEYTSSVDALEQDFRRASVLLMPSRREGFGLVALEALQAGIPVLVSNKSGFSQLLREKIEDPEILQNFIVTTVDDVNQSAEYWCKAIEFILRDRKAAFSRAAELNRILSSNTWQSSSEALISAAFDSTPI